MRAFSIYSLDANEGEKSEHKAIFFSMLDKEEVNVNTVVENRVQSNPNILAF